MKKDTGMQSVESGRMNNPTAICFDWDGTVIDSMHDKFHNFVNAILSAFNIEDRQKRDQLAIYRQVIDFCHKEHGGELRVNQFDNVVNSLCHPNDLLRILQHLRDDPSQLEDSSYQREAHLYENFRDELNGDDRDSFNQWIRSLTAELSSYLAVERKPFPEFSDIHDRNERFCRFDSIYTKLNQKSSEHWEVFPASRHVIKKLADDFDLYIASSLLGPLLRVEVAEYPEIEKYMTEIYGGDKSEAIRTVKNFGYDSVVFVGDMPADRVVAEQNNAFFYRIHPRKGQGNIDWQTMIDRIGAMTG